MRAYYLESETLTVAGDWARVVLCANESGKLEYKQDFQLACWTPLQFESAAAALKQARELCDKSARLLLHDDLTIWAVDSSGDFIEPTYMRVTRDPED